MQTCDKSNYVAQNAKNKTKQNKTLSAKLSPENKHKVLFLCLLGLVGGVVQRVATVVGWQHLDELQVGVALVPLENLTALFQNDLLLVVAEAEEHSLLPHPLLLLSSGRLAHLHLVEDGDDIIRYSHSGGLHRQTDREGGGEGGIGAC